MRKGKKDEVQKFTSWKIGDQLKGDLARRIVEQRGNPVSAGGSWVSVGVREKQREEECITRTKWGHEKKWMRRRNGIGPGRNTAER